MKIKDITVVIRSAGERTLDLCHSIVSEQVYEKNIFILELKPFSKAVFRTFEIGIEHNNKWTLAIDADVLISKTAIQRMIDDVTEVNFQNKIFVYQGNILCNVFQKPRPGGCHMYQTMYLKRALSFCKQTEKNLKPESSIYKKMNELGLYTYVNDKIYGIHDYFQWNKDMYKSGFFQAIKHPKESYTLLKEWKNKLNKDIDFEALIEGWKYGVSFTKKIEVNSSFFEDILVDEYKKTKLIEKSMIQKSEYKSIRKEIEKFMNSNQKALVLYINPSIVENKLSKKLIIKIADFFIKVGEKIKYLYNVE